jgi:hypothetical protein
MAKRMACLAVLFVLAAPTTCAQPAEDLRQKLEQLKQEYEQKLQGLEQRIAALEKQGSQRSVPTQTPPQQSAPSDLGQAVGEGVKTAILGQAQTAQGQLPSEPSYDQLQEARTKISDWSVSLLRSHDHSVRLAFPSASGAILATAGIGVVNVVMTIVSMWLIDRVGRRLLLLIGTAGMIVSLGALGLIFALLGGLAWVAVVCLMAYVASFAISLGPIFWLLISEIYPLKIRGLAEGTAAATNWGANLLVSLTFLTLLNALGPSRTFWIYGLLAIGSWFFSNYLVPETKGRTLEEIELTWRIGRSAAVRR